MTNGEAFTQINMCRSYFVYAIGALTMILAASIYQTLRSTGYKSTREDK